MITSDHLTKAAAMAGDLLTDYQDEINEAFQNSKTGRITVSVAIGFRVSPKGLETKVRIKAKTGEINDESLEIDSQQMQLEGVG